ncbi:MAG: polysaccharide biosynthesis/export family protein [Myxococcaceae bacterium]
MNRALAIVVVSALVTGCYTPRGSFLEVDNANVGEGSDTIVINPGDTIQVRVFQQEAMSARVKVRSDGKVSLPLVNDVMVGGKAPSAVAQELQVKLKDFINTPVVTVSLEETRPVTVSVLGEVPRAGVVTVEAGSGVLQALAAAGGLTDFAHRDGIFVLRKQPGQPAPKRIRFRFEQLTQGDGPAARFVLQPGDVIVAE